ncbi:MAG TPA: efflux RND transporter periplasmic adaptor subunit [Steroidobacteraceae bacterium]|jgi:multidrug efflux system membrane fusion protein
MTLLNDLHRRCFICLSAAALLAGCGGGAANGGGPPAPQVTVAAVIARDVTQWDEFTGRVSAVETVDLTPRVGGYIEKVAYREGQEVKQGDVLFVIDARSYRAESERADAELDRARSRVELAKSELARAKTLADARAISKEEYDQRESALSQATSEVHVAEAARDIARLNLGFTEVRAPISGRAGRALITIGNLAKADSTVLTTLVSLDPVYVYFEGDEQAYLHYNEIARAGGRKSSRDARNPVRIGLANEQGYPHEGVVDFLDNQVDPLTGTIRARAVLANADRIFTPGLFARVQLLGSDKFPAVLIDDKAVMTDQDRKYVYVVGADNKAVRKDIVLGRLSDGLRIVTSGLASNDRVIIAGMQKVFAPGMTVQPQLVSMESAAPGKPAAATPGQQH